MTCYIEVHEDGTVTHGNDRAATDGPWLASPVSSRSGPGEWSNHLFVIDDLDEYAKVHGIMHDEERTGLKEHVYNVRWEPAPYANDSPRSPYISVDITLDCGCEIHDLRTFAAQMKEQQGWDVATSGGWGSSGNPGGRKKYSLCVRRKSLTR